MLLFITFAAIAIQLSPPVDAKCAFHHHTWTRDLKFCFHPKSKLHIGDFNGDGRADMLCRDDTGRTWISFARKAGTFMKTDSFKQTHWCPEKSGNQILLGDFNGDGRTDQFCHNTLTGYVKIAFANQDGTFNGVSWQKKLDWCHHPTAKLLIGDFNGDGRSDLLCHDTGNGYKWISFANAKGEFTGTSWQGNTGWCAGKHAALSVGDFNGDEKDDILCHTTAGDNWILLANEKGILVGKGQKGIVRWCGVHGRILIGDFNGDGRSDLLCHRVTDGYKWISYSLPNLHFPTTDWQRNMRWCGGGAPMYVADYNGDGKDDILCHDTRRGRKWIVFAEC